MELANSLKGSQFVKADLVKEPFKNYKCLHQEIDSGAELSVDKFLNDGLLVALNRQALGLESCRGHYYNLLFKWTEQLELDALDISLAKESSPGAFDHSLYLLETIVPISDRKKLGEHYTPPEIVDYIIQKTISKDVKSTLDPAVGSGAFLTGWLKYQLHVNQENSVAFSGFDINPTSLAISELNLERFMRSNPQMMKNISVRLELKDSLKEYLNYNPEDPSFFYGELFDTVIGNPPYVRVQNIQPAEKRDIYRLGYPESAVGRFDLYMLFVEMGGRALNKNGALGFIVSNKIMTANAAMGVRSHIGRVFDMENLIDLGDSKLFQAAVLPVILIMRLKTGIIKKRAICGNVKEVKLDVAKSTKDSIAVYPLNILDKLNNGQTRTCLFNDQHFTKFACSIERVDMQQSDFNGTNTWHINNQEVDCLIEKIRSAGPSLSSICKTISAGIKSTADDVFCKPITNDFIKQHNLEKQYIHPYLQAKNVTKWQINWSGNAAKKDTYVIYPHKDSGGRTIPVELEDMPNIASWFTSNKAQLAGRKYVLEAGRRWYEIWVPQKVGYFTSKYKIVTPDFSTHNRYALDLNGHWCGGNAFMIIPEKQDRTWALFLLGILNSSVLEYFHKKASSTFIYAGRYRYTATSIKKYPIPKVDDSQVTAIAGLVELLIENPNEINSFEKLDLLVASFYGLKREELKTIKQHLGN